MTTGYDRQRSDWPTNAPGGHTIDASIPTLPVGVFHASPDGRIISDNTALRELLGGVDARTPAPTPWWSAHPGDRAAAELAWRRAVEAHDTFATTFRVWRRSGDLGWIRLSATPIFDHLGRLTGYSGTAIDDTDAIAKGVMLERLLNVVSVGEPMLIVDRHGSPLYTNEAACELFRVKDPVDLVRNEALRSLLRTVRDQIPRELLNSSATEQWSGEVGFRAPGGPDRTLHLDLVIKRDDQGVTEFWGGVARDVTDDRERRSQLLKQSTHDPLTGLPNRALLQRRITDALERTRNTNDNVALLFLDLDNLKDVNDRLGHDVGDGLIAQVAAKISFATRPTDLVARIGGDEFVVLCYGPLDAHGAFDIAERVRRSLSGTTTAKGVPVELTVSIGVALSTPLNGVNAADAAQLLLRHADTAMYLAKRRGGSRCEMFTPAMQAALDDRRKLADQLEQALARDELRLVYQPIMSILSGATVAAEALLRWHHDERGVLAPAQFLAVAEETGVIVPIGDWVLTQACIETRAWIDAGLVDSTFSVHVNISPRQLAEGSFVERVQAIVRSMDLAPHQLTLDFNEVALTELSPGGQRALRALRRFGVRVAFDDFGTGVSSLSALRTCRADILKLDGSISRGLANSPADGADDPVVRAIIQLAHALEMEVVAEWVTSADQLHQLRALGCDMVQGFLVGEPSEHPDFSR